MIYTCQVREDQARDFVDWIDKQFPELTRELGPVRHGFTMISITGSAEEIGKLIDQLTYHDPLDADYC